MRKISIVGFLVFSFLAIWPAACLFAFDDVRYDIDASFSPQKKTIEARETVSFVNDSGQDLDAIYLRVYPNHKYSAKEKERLYRYASYFKIDPYPYGFDEGEFSVASVSSSERLLDYAFEGDDQTVMKVVLAGTLKQGESIKLEIAFSLKVPHRLGRYGWHKDTFALNRWYPILGFYDKDGWRLDPDYLLHMPYVSDAAMYDLKFSLPRDYVLASGCDMIKEEERTDGTRVVSLSSSAPLRELSLAVSRDYLVDESEYDGIKIRSFYFKKDKVSAGKAMGSARDLIAFYSINFGKYPYKQFSIAPVYLGYGGSQNAGIVFIDTRAYQMPPFLERYFDFLVAHETGHQWWYNMVGSNEYCQLWLDEGINSYFITRYLEAKYGKDGKVVTMPGWLNCFIPNPTFRSIRTYRYRYFVKKGLDQPIITEMCSFYEPSMIFTIAYGKGSAIPDMLRSLMGEEKFSLMMKKYFETFKFKNATVADFEKIASEAAGEDLAWFFKEWLYEAKVCDYAVERRRGKLTLRRLGGVVMPVETKLAFTDDTEMVVHSDGKSEAQEIPLPQGKILKKAIVDEGSKFLDIDRTNNCLPRKIDVRLVPAYHKLYEVPLFLEEDAFSWITGPSFSEYGFGIKSSFQKPVDYIVYAATHYDTSSQSLNSSVGFEKNNILNNYLSWGFEFFNRNAFGDEESDLNSYKLYLRQELDFPYSLVDVNSHLTLYMVHNQSLGKDSFIGAREEPRNLNYRQNKETIFGVTFYRSTAGPLPDPSLGYKFSATQEIAGHILGGGDDFSRTQGEFDRYIEIAPAHKLALRLKGGAGHPKDKYLFYLGSDRELRGYDYKDIKGSSCVLASTEYRFPIVREMDARFFWQTFNLSSIQGVLFFDAGSAWFNSFFEPGFKKDVGLGVRFFFDVAGGVEKFALRLDVAQPLDSPDNDTHVWVGINHVF
ncbi:MAG: BamA/TamA family outer membrane protein [Candidatus Omnitrophica bacterium]|nr:BamA/TamA family outer membrane protein [Candidatus Omnitrophota bacterium]